MNPPNPERFQRKVAHVRKSVIQAFSQSLHLPVTEDGMTLEEMVNVEMFMRLGTYIDHYFAPYLPPYPNRGSMDAGIPLGSDEKPSVKGLIEYLESHWLPELLEQTSTGAALTIEFLDSHIPGATRFQLGVRRTPEAFEAVEPQAESTDLLDNLRKELGD